MRELLHETVKEYLGHRLQLNEPEMDEIGCAISAIAYFGNMPEMDDLADYVGVSLQKFVKDVCALANESFDGEVFKHARDNYLWLERPTPRSFLVAIAAGLIEYGFWTESYKESEERMVARETIRAIAPASVVRSPSEFRGYVATIEYLWYSIRGFDTKPNKWIRDRYGAKSGRRKDINNFLTAVVKRSGYEFDQEIEKKPSMLLTGLKRRAKNNWRDCQEGRMN